MNQNSLRIVVIWVAVAALIGACGAAEVDSAEGAPIDEPQTLESAILGGKVDINLRLRAELVDQDGLKESRAYTSRLRLGYGSKPYQGLSFYVDFEDIRAADDDRYNAAGLNANGAYAVVADPEDTELNQPYLKYAHDRTSTKVVAGRQRIILDDARFVGNVGWRQNEQTFDAVKIEQSFMQDFTLLYAYLWDVNRIFGPDSNRDFESDSHIVNVSYAGVPTVKITVFAYVLDFDNSAASSSDTYGLRVSGKQPVSEEFTAAYILSYAHQNDASNNPTSYDASYYLVEGQVIHKLAAGGVGYEVLGSDNQVAAFATPLATLHKFSGWADVFLATPVTELEDIYVVIGDTSGQD